MLRLTTDEHKASRGLSATAELGYLYKTLGGLVFLEAKSQGHMGPKLFGGLAETTFSTP